MSIPDRLWRALKGRWEMTVNPCPDPELALAEAAAYQELAQALRSAPIPAGAPLHRAVPGAPPPGATGGMDPLEACYSLLQVEPGSSMEALQLAYQARRAELQPERFAAGSAARAALDGRRAAVDAAYEKLRDVLNPTETRFEHLEF